MTFFGRTGAINWDAIPLNDAGAINCAAISLNDAGAISWDAFF